MSVKIGYFADGSENDLAKRFGPIAGPTLNVRDPTYGATGNGVTDDTAAITNAIAAAVVASGAVYIPPGTYRINRSAGTDNISGNNVRITGAGPSTMLVNAAPITGGGSQLYNAFSASGRSGIVIENLAVAGFTVGSFLGCTDVSVRNVHAVGLRGTQMHDKGVYVHQCRRVRVEGCDFTNYTFHVYLSGDAGTRSDGVAVVGNTFENNVAAGSFTAPFPVGVYVYYADDVIVGGNTFRDIYSSVDGGDAGTGMGYGVYEGDGACRSLAVTGNTFAFTGNGSKRATGVYVNYASVATISGNSFRSAASANLTNAIRCSIKSSPAYRTVVGNTIDGTGLIGTVGQAQAILMDNAGSPASARGALVVQDNAIYGGRIRVDLTRAASPDVAVKVAGNVVDGCPLNGGAIIVAGAAGMPAMAPDVSRNVVRNAVGSGILLAYALRAKVADNQIQNCNTGGGSSESDDLSGVVFTSHSYGALVTGNTVVNTPGGDGQTKYALNFFSSAQVFRFVYHHNIALGLTAGGALYWRGYTAAPTGGWDWQVGDFATNAALATGKPAAWYCVHRADLTLAVDAGEGDTALTLADTTGLMAGDPIFLWKNADTIDMDTVTGDAARYHITTIASVDSATQVTLADAIPAGESYLSGSAAVRAVRWQAGPAIGGAALTSTQIADLTDGGDSALHFHAADRSRANHTGTQALSTITGGVAAGAGYTLPDLRVGKTGDGKGGFVRLIDDGGTERWSAGLTTNVGERDWIVHDWVHDLSRIRIDATTGVVALPAGVSAGGALAHTGATAGFFSVTPASRPAALVQTYNAADRTLGAYTADAESTAYTGQDNAQTGTVYAKLDDLNALRVAYENLRASHEDLMQFVNALVDDMQLLGLEQ